MAGKIVQFRRGTTLQHSFFTGADGEITVDIQKKAIVVHDGVTEGGFVSASIDDAVTNASRTWSSTNISNEIDTRIDALFDDAAIYTDKVWSSDRTFDFVTGLFDDNDTDPGKLWSSAKIQSELDAIDSSTLPDADRAQTLDVTLNDIYSQINDTAFSISPITTNAYTFALSDTDPQVYKRYTAAGAGTITVPDNATVAVGVGESITIRNQSSDDADVTLTPAGGVTLNGTAVVAVGTTAVLIKVATDEWDIN